MKATSQTIQQIERALRKIAAKYPQGREDLVLTDIHLQVKPIPASCWRSTMTMKS